MRQTGEREQGESADMRQTGGAEQNETGFLWEDAGDGIRLTKFLGGTSEVVIPEEINGKPVRILGSHAFYENGMDVERIVTPHSMRVIEPYACEFCMSLTDFQIAEGVEVLGREFLIATQQETLKIPASVRMIEEPAELGIPLLIAPDNPWYHSDGTALFRRCDLPEDGSKEDERKEGGCSLETILSGVELTEYTVPEGVTKIAHDAFETQDALERIHLPKSLCVLDEGVLSNPKSHFAKGRGIYKISITEGNPYFFTDETGLYRRLSDGGVELIKYLGRKREIVLSDAIRIVGKGAFNKSRVEEITIPATVETIWPDAFLDCPIKEVDFQAYGFRMYFPSAHPYVLKQVLEGFGRNGRLYDFSCYDKVLTDDAWNEEKAKMMIWRMHYPKDLTDEAAQDFRGRLNERLSALVPKIGGKQELLVLQWMTELGFFTRENIDALIESLNVDGSREAMAVLMDYKNREFGRTEFDFSL